MVRTACVVWALFLLSGCQRETFFCDTSEDCVSKGGGGACEPTGYCSFPDPDCDTNRRYGKLAPSRLAGTCVPRSDDTEASSGTASTSGTSTSTSSSNPTIADVTSSTTRDSDTTVITAGPSRSGTGSGSSDSSTTGDLPTCCEASCSTCGESCASEVLDSTDGGEALAIAVVGTTVVWTTGYTREVVTVDLTSGESTLLAELPHEITSIAADDEHVYYLSYSNGFVGRISLTTGAQTVIVDANTEGPGGGLEAGYGQLVLDGDAVYFALVGAGDAPGAAFRTPKRYSPNSIERIGALEHPIGIGVDENTIYVSDQAEGTLFRFDKGSPEADGVEMLELPAPGHLYVADTDVYATGSGQLTRVPKNGEPSTMLVATGGVIRGIAGDEAHVYVTDLQGGSVTRVSLFDTEAPAQIATSPGAWGIATDCNHVYWCENDSLSVLRQPK